MDWMRSAEKELKGYQMTYELRTIKVENMDRVDSMTKVPPPDNNGRRVPVSASSLMCASHPSAQNHLSTCHFPFAFKGPFHADAWPDSQTATEENGHLAKGLEFSLSLCKLMKMRADVLQDHAKKVPPYMYLTFPA